MSPLVGRWSQYQAAGVAGAIVRVIGGGRPWRRVPGLVVHAHARQAVVLAFRPVCVATVRRGVRILCRRRWLQAVE